MPRALLADTLWTEAIAPGQLAAQTLTAAAAVADAGPADRPAGSAQTEQAPGARLLTWLAVAQGLGCVACVLNHQLVDAALIRRLHDLGLRAMVYTVNDSVRAAELLSWGLDSVITDAVDVMTPTC